MVGLGPRKRRSVPENGSDMIPAASPAPQPATRDRPSSDWKRLWRDAVRDPRELLDLLGLGILSGRLSDVATAQFPLRVPRGFVMRMRHGDPHDPLLRQVLPLDDEDRIVPGFALDAVGDAAARTGAGVIQKYRGRALLVATGSCAVHCRYCFRRHFPYSEETATANRWATSLDAVRRDPSIEELLLSGGDPLSLSTAKLAELVDGARDIPHLRRLRLHTRLPIVLPSRVEPSLLALLSRSPWPVAIVLHANHANELDESVAHAIGELRA